MLVLLMLLLYVIYICCFVFFDFIFLCVCCSSLEWEDVFEYIPLHLHERSQRLWLGRFEHSIEYILCIFHSKTVGWEERLTTSSFSFSRHGIARIIVTEQCREDQVVFIDGCWFLLAEHETEETARDGTSLCRHCIAAQVCW